jgi:hypothetical protein
VTGDSGLDRLMSKAATASSTLGMTKTCLMMEATSNRNPSPHTTPSTNIIETTELSKDIDESTISS